MHLKDGAKIYYIEYMDHGSTPEPVNVVQKNPLILWCCGFIVNENQKNDPYYALISRGTRFRPQKPDYYEYVMKSAILKKEIVHVIKDNVRKVNEND